MPILPTKSTYKPPKTHGGGILGDIAHVVEGTSKGLYHGVTGLPTGVVMTGRVLGHDAIKTLAPALLKTASGDITAPIRAAAQVPKTRTGQLAKEIGKAEYSSYRHFGKGGDVSGPLLDAIGLLTGGSSLSARTAKTLSEISKGAKASRAAHAADLIKKDTAVMQAVGSSGIKGIGWDKAASIYKVPARDLKKHYSRNRELLQEGNFSVGKPAGTQGKYANVRPAEVLADPSHPLFEGYARRYPGKPSKTQAGIPTSMRARKAFMQKPTYSRPLMVGKPFQKKRSGLYVPTSPNPLFRAIRAGREQIRPEGSANKDLKKEVIRREATQERFLAPKGLRMAPTQAPTDPSVATQLLQSPMAALRMGMWLRPRYYLQNIAQTGQMLGTSPIASSKSTKLAADIFRKDRDLYHQLRAITGEAQAGSLAIGTSPSRVGSAIGSKVGGRVGKQIEDRGVLGAMGYAANIPESHVRLLSVLNELQRHHASLGNLGDLTPKQVEQYIGNVRRSGVLAKEHLPIRRAMEEVGDFSRIYSSRSLRPKKNEGKFRVSRLGEKEFMQTQIPIFYPMFKALARYGFRFPSEHPLASAAGLHLGTQGKKEQKRLLGDLPFWAQYLIPKSAGDPNAKRSPKQAVWNPSNIYNLQPATDIARQTVEAARVGGPVPGLSLLQETGPAPGIAYGIATGKDIQTGYPIKPFEKGTYRKHPFLNTSAINTGVDFAEGLPYANLAMALAGQKPNVRSYERGTKTDALLQELFGPATVSRFLKTNETTKQAKREARYGKGRKPAHKKSGWR